MLTLFAVPIALALTAGTFLALEAVLGRTPAAVLCPVGWLTTMAVEEAIDLMGGGEE